MLNDARHSSKKYIWHRDLQTCAAGSMGSQRLCASSFSWIHMIKIRCFFSAAGGATGSKRCCGKMTVSCCCTNAWIMVPSDGRVRQAKHWN